MQKKYYPERTVRGNTGAPGVGGEGEQETGTGIGVKAEEGGGELWIRARAV